MKSKKSLKKPASPDGRVSTALNLRVQELGIKLSGLPPRVTAHLREIVKEELHQVRTSIETDIDAIERRADLRFRQRIAALVTLKAIGKAFTAAADIGTRAEANPDQLELPFGQKQP